MTEPGKSAPPDPFQMWRDWVSSSERQWNEFFNQAMGTDEFGRGMGKMMDAYLETQRGFGEAFGRYFSAMNLPTRTDVLTLSNRISGIEERLGAIETLLRAMAPDDAERPSPKQQTKRPPRTKKPPAD